MKLAVVFPSRGLAFSQTVEELYRELNSTGGDYTVFFSHGRPIPDCFEIPTQEALKGDFDAVLYAEDDMVFTEGILNKMIARDVPAVACDYPVGGGSGGTVMYDPDGKAFFTGCGLLLVKMELLRRMPAPIWRDDVRWKPYMDSGLVHFAVTTDDAEHYGQQDVAFGLRLYANGMPIEVMDETIGQREVVVMGKDGTNQGQHKVVDRMEVVPRTDLMNLKQRPMFEEIIIDGKRVKVKQSTLKKLGDVERPDDIRAGRAIFDVPRDLRQWLLLKKAR